MAYQYVTEAEKREAAMNFNVQAGRSLSDLNGLLTAALCVLRFEEDYTDTSEDDKKQALETLLEQSRAAVGEIKEGYEGVWHITAGFIFATTSDDPPPEVETEQAERSA